MVGIIEHDSVPFDGVTTIERRTKVVFMRAHVRPSYRLE